MHANTFLYGAWKCMGVVRLEVGGGADLHRYLRNEIPPTTYNALKFAFSTGQHFSPQMGLGGVLCAISENEVSPGAQRGSVGEDIEYLNQSNLGPGTTGNWELKMGPSSSASNKHKKYLLKGGSAENGDRTVSAVYCMVCFYVPSDYKYKRAIVLRNFVARNPQHTQRWLSPREKG